MKLHQSAWALLPCTRIRPGLPRSPHARSSIFAPKTSTNERSGAWAIAHLNQSGAGGSRPLNGVSGPSAGVGGVTVAAEIAV